MQEEKNNNEYQDNSQQEFAEDMKKDIELNIEKEINIDVDSINENVQNNEGLEEEDNSISELKSKSIEIKKNLENTVKTNDNANGEFLMAIENGELVNPRNVENSKVKVAYVKIENILIPSRVREESSDETFILQEQIKLFGQLEPIVVIPYTEDDDDDEEPLYLLAHGYRRIKALQALGEVDILAVVDSSIPTSLAKHYEPIFNATKPYKFTEQLSYGTFIKSTQKMIGYDTVEGILGLKSGDFYKALYIDSFKNEFADIFKQVDTGKISIEQGFKKIEKEIEKREKEMSAIDELNSGELDDQLRNTNELLSLNNDAGNQEVGNRKVLDAVIRRSIESRDNGYCQCCGYGENEPDLMGVFHVHHIIAVQYGGSDNKSNLVLVCNNCHTLIHDYEKGRFLPDKTTFDRLKYVQKIVVLGNMLATMKQKGLHYLRVKHPDIFRLVDAGKESLGKSLLKVNADLEGEKLYNNSPYDTFVQCALDIDKGNVNSELQTVNWEDNIDENNKDLKLLHSGEIEEKVATDEDLDNLFDKNLENTVLKEQSEKEENSEIFSSIDVSEEIATNEEKKNINGLEDIFDLNSKETTEPSTDKSDEKNDNQDNTDDLNILNGLLE